MKLVELHQSARDHAVARDLSHRADDFAHFVFVKAGSGHAVADLGLELTLYLRAHPLETRRKCVVDDEGKLGAFWRMAFRFGMKSLNRQDAEDFAQYATLTHALHGHTHLPYMILNYWSKYKKAWRRIVGDEDVETLLTEMDDEQTA